MLGLRTIVETVTQGWVLFKAGQIPSFCAVSLPGADKLPTNEETSVGF